MTLKVLHFTLLIFFSPGEAVNKPGEANMSCLVIRSVPTMNYSPAMTPDLILGSHQKKSHFNCSVINANLFEMTIFGLLLFLSLFVPHFFKANWIDEFKLRQIWTAKTSTCPSSGQQTTRTKRQGLPPTTQCECVCVYVRVRQWVSVRLNTSPPV